MNLDPRDEGAAGGSSNNGMAVTADVLDGHPIVRKRASRSPAVERLRHEAAVLGELQHPAVVTVMEAADNGETVELQLSYAGRESLASWTPPTIDALVAVSIAFLDSLMDIHDLGWTHGNVVAEHCVIGPNGRAAFCSWSGAQRVIDGGDKAIRVDIGALGRALQPLVLRVHEEGRGRLRNRRSTAGLVELLDELARGVDRRGAQRVRENLSSIHSARSTRPHTDQTDRPGRSAARASRHRRERRQNLLTVATTIVLSCSLWVLVARPLGGTRDEMHEPAVSGMLFGILRWSAVACCAYLLLAIMLTTVARLTDRGGAIDAAQRFTAGPLKKASVFVIGAGVLSATATRPTSLTLAPEQLVDLGAPEGAGSLPESTDRRFPESREPPASPPGVPTPGSGIPGSEIPEASLQNPIETDREEGFPDTWIVAPGDHFWSIAETTLARRHSTAPTSSDVAEYWRSLVDANRGSLIDPQNPDLIHRGQVLVLP